MPTKKFKPFEHDDLELKNQLIEYARSISGSEDIGAQLGSAMIYASFAEYVAGHLLENLRHLMYQTTYREFAAILFIDERARKKGKPQTMGQVIAFLENYGFPDKEEVLELLKSIGKSRNNLFHNFAQLDAEGVEKLFASDLSNIKEKTEDLFTKVNVIYAGLQKILINPGTTSISTEKET